MDAGTNAGLEDHGNQPSLESEPARPSVRPRRSRKAPAVGVTGASYGVGAVVAARLSGSEQVRKVVGLDAVRGSAPPATWRVVDLTDPALATRLEGLDVLVHRVVVDADGPDALRVAETVLTSAAAASVRRAVLITSASVYGAHADNEVPLAEDSPLRAEPDGSSAGRLLEVEALVGRSRLAHPGLEVTVLRPATIVGTGEPSLVSRHFESPRILVVRGAQPHWQFVHVDDLAAAVELAVLGRVTGDVTVGADGWLTQEAVERLSGRRRVELPAALAMGTAERLHRLGVTSAPASELAYVSQPWVVPSTALRAAGWTPTWDNESCFELLLEGVAHGFGVTGQRIGGRLGSRIGGKEAALGATGATVAVLGTAAVVRQIRRHRRSL
jgi:nucleoside-diphosphate-sugar epimerase